MGHLLGYARVSTTDQHPQLQVDALTAAGCYRVFEVLADCIRIQVRLLRTLLGSLAELDRALAAALGEHPKATVLQPLPRIGQINLAQILAEVGPILDRASDLTHAAAEVAPPRSPSSPATGPWSSSAGRPTPVPATP